MNSNCHLQLNKYFFKELKSFQGLVTTCKYKIVTLYLEKWQIKN